MHRANLSLQARLLLLEPTEVGAECRPFVDLAVQNLAENAMMLLMIGIYTLAVRAHAPITGIAAAFGAVLSLSIAGLWVHRVRKLKVATARQ